MAEAVAIFGFVFDYKSYVALLKCRSSDNGPRGQTSLSQAQAIRRVVLRQERRWMEGPSYW